MPKNLKDVITVSTIVVVVVGILADATSDSYDGRSASCLANLQQIGIAMSMYVSDYDGKFPDRRDLKGSLPGGYRPWTGWPSTDPRAGWTIDPLSPYMKTPDLYRCPAVSISSLGHAPQVLQMGREGHYDPWSPKREENSDKALIATNYWMWGFDKKGKTVTLDNFWGKTADQVLADLQRLNDSQAGFSRPERSLGSPDSLSQVELMSDPYLPLNSGAKLAGVTVHRAPGRNVVYLDIHAKFVRIERVPGWLTANEKGAGPSYLNP